jgi:hypothetical protein
MFIRINESLIHKTYYFGFDDESFQVVVHSQFDGHCAIERF